MNNFINFGKWFQRGQLERKVISRLNKNYPNVEQNIAAHRYPTLPKIVVYSASTSSDSFLKNIFPFYQLVTPNPTAETDEIITKRIAEQLILGQNNQSQDGQTHFGFILKGFPFNANQALLLDRYINGVNLAIHLKSGEQSADYVSSIQSLLTYYDQRGTLLSLTHGKQSDMHEIENALNEIRIKIKRSF